ncbi:MAG: MFS transporter [Acidobacteria bacterium]|nr:MAG: MFS transporter [Acidobacteriota bacterium]
MTDPDSTPSSRAWLVLVLLWGVAFSYYLTRNMLTTMHGSIVAAIRMTDRQFGLLTSVFLWVYALMNPLGGALADRFSRSRVIIASMLAWSAVTWLTGHATTFPQLLALRAVMGISQGCYMPAATALITDYHRGSTRSLAVGLHITGLVLGSTASGLGGWLAERHDWTYAFSLVGLPSLALGVLLLFSLRDAPHEEGREALESGRTPAVRFGPALISLLSNGSFLALILIYVLQSSVSWVVIGWMPTYMQEQFHLNQGAAGFSATGYLSVTQLVSLIASGFWSDRWSRRNVRARLWVPAIGLAVAAPSFWLAEYSGLLFATILCLSLWGMAVGFMGSNMMPVLCLFSDRRHRATAYGIANGVGSVAGGLAVYGAGVLRDLQVDLRRVLSFTGVCALLCSALFLLVRTDREEARNSARAARGS